MASPSEGRTHCEHLSADAVQQRQQHRMLGGGRVVPVVGCDVDLGGGDDVVANAADDTRCDVIASDVSVVVVDVDIGVDAADIAIVDSSVPNVSAADV